MVPTAISRCLRATLGDKCVGRLNRCQAWALYERNPLLQIFYLAVLLGAYCDLVLEGYPRIPCARLPGWHRWAGLACLALCLRLWYLACTVPAGAITRETLARFDRYPCDELMFAAGRICPTTGLPKLARSKVRVERSSVTMAWEPA